MWLYIIVISTGISLTTHDVGHLLMCFAHSLIGLLGIFNVELGSSLSVLGTGTWSDTGFTNIFSLSYHSLHKVFQGVFILIIFSLSFFPFMRGVKPKNVLLIPRCPRFSPMHFSIFYSFTSYI